MPKLNKNEELYFEKLFGMSTGYVLDFSNTTFRNFVKESIDIDIYDDKYSLLGTSKANRLRSLINLEDTYKVSKLLIDLSNYWKALVDINKLKADDGDLEIYKKCLDIANNMTGRKKMSRNPKAFISYSWDSKEHEEWVMKFYATLRKYGIDAKLDKFETQGKTVNLNHMMVENIRDNDYTIVIMTDKYAEKANKLIGGVGIETQMLYNYISTNKNKIILVKRDTSSKCIPFYLEGLSYIDFSNNEKLSESFDELLRRILDIKKYEDTNLGIIPNLQTKKIEPFKINIGTENNKSNIYDDLIPDLKNSIKPSDLDRDRFIRESYTEIKTKLLDVLKLTKERNPEFEYELDEINPQKQKISVYLNGEIKYSTKIWINNFISGGEKLICVLYGKYISDSDTSMNEMIECIVDENNQLFLKMLNNNNKCMTTDEVFRNIWLKITDNLK